MSFDFRKWYDDAQRLVVMMAKGRHWKYRSLNYGNSVSVTDDPTPEQVRQRFRDAHAKSEAEAAAILLEVQAIREGQAKLREHIETLWPMLEVGYFDLRDFKTEGLPGGRCAWVAIDNLAEDVARMGEQLAIAREYGRSLNCKELNDLDERGRWLERTVDAIRARLTLEKSWLLKHATHPLVTTQGEATPPSPPKEKNKGGRPPETTPERAEQVQRWWGQFLDDPKPEGYQTPKHFRKRSEDDFLAWGEFLELPNFPTNRDEVKSCKKRYRDLHPPKPAKTKRRKRR